MANYFLDSSALVKYYVTEPGSTWVRRLIDGEDPITGRPLHFMLVAEITRVEVAAGIAVIERMGRIRKRERQREYVRFISQLIHRFVVIALSGEVLEEAADLTQRHPLKAYDAVQLAVASRQNRALATVRQSLIFISGDKTLLTAAKAEGLAADNPFDHVSPQDTPTASSIS